MFGACTGWNAGCRRHRGRGKNLPRYIQQEFDDFLQCGRMEYGFLRVRCEDCHYERLVAFSCKRRGFCPSCGARRMEEIVKKAGFTKATAQSGSVTLIQRFGSALNLNVHYYLLFLDGVYAEDDEGRQRFHRVKAPTHRELNALVHTLSQRIARCLEKRGLLERDAENTWLTLEQDDDEVLTQLPGHSVTYRIATGPQQGRKVFTLQTLPGRDDKVDTSSRVANHAGFSLHAGVMAEASPR